MTAIPEFSMLRQRAGLSTFEAAMLIGEPEATIIAYDRASQPLPSAKAMDVIRRLASVDIDDGHITYTPIEPPKPIVESFEFSEVGRYSSVSASKAQGVTYTPEVLADFVARAMVDQMEGSTMSHIRILDPAIGDGALILSLLGALCETGINSATVCGFDTDVGELEVARRRIQAAFPDVVLDLKSQNFLEFVEANGGFGERSLFDSETGAQYDLVIANPPYVRTQVMGTERAQALAGSFGLTGRTDLYHAFLVAIARVLSPQGTAGLIVSNRFMTTRGGASVRAALRQQLNLRHVWDLGDTKLFDAAVLPAVIVACGRALPITTINFSAIYETQKPGSFEATDPIAALSKEGVVTLCDARRFHVQHGILDGSGAIDDVWRIATERGDAWVATVDKHCSRRFGDIGKVRVGVKTCADKVFIRTDWPTDKNVRPELLQPLITHHSAGRFRSVPDGKDWAILYPHMSINGRRQAVDIDLYPQSKAYLNSHRACLEGRRYVIEAARKWFEIWVPQDPVAWQRPKLIFRDISEQPTFWLDFNGSVVNGDCYWLMLNDGEDEDLLWLAAAVANSTFIEDFYDHRFNNKLYAGRRRFITQYVEKFPLPDPKTTVAQEIVSAAKARFNESNGAAAQAIETKIDRAVWQAFGLSYKEGPR
jgi:adenine-specific DNA-methyltransferase